MSTLEQAFSLPQDWLLEKPGQLPSAFAVSDLAAQSVGAVGSALAEFMLVSGLASKRPDVIVNQHLASLWFGFSIQPVGWTLPPVWDTIAGVYATQDGFIRLHTNLEHHRLAALRVLGVRADKSQVANAVAGRTSDQLERAILDEGGVAAALRSRSEWQNHPQGKAVSQEPLIDWKGFTSPAIHNWCGSPEKPLRGIKVLDLTRVLAGPVATRTLAGLGANVLRIDPPGWDEANIVPDITLGKRCATLNLHEDHDRAVFESLLSEADVLVHGYRPGALDKLGFGESVRRKLAPGLTDVSLCAYGWTGPWAGRRGFDSLVQMSTGIAHSGMQWASKPTPVPLPVQALDHATGYLMAACALCGLSRRFSEQKVLSARLSLARTAEWLFSLPEYDMPAEDIQATKGDYNVALENTAWGPARRLNAPFSVEGVSLNWPYPAGELGSSPASWR